MRQMNIPFLLIAPLRCLRFVCRFEYNSIGGGSNEQKKRKNTQQQRSACGDFLFVRPRPFVRLRWRCFPFFCCCVCLILGKICDLFNDDSVTTVQRALFAWIAARAVECARIGCRGPYIGTRWIEEHYIFFYLNFWQKPNVNVAQLITCSNSSDSLKWLVIESRWCARSPLFW